MNLSLNSRIIGDSVEAYALHISMILQSALSKAIDFEVGSLLY
jgi:hypothetical protein